MDEALAQTTEEQQQLTEARSENTRLQSELWHVEGVAEQWADIAQHAQDVGDRLERERDEAIASYSQIQQQLNEAKRQNDESQTQIATLQEFEGLYHTAVGSAERWADIAQHAQEVGDRLERERDLAQAQLAALQQQLTQAQADLAQVQAQSQPLEGLDLEALARERDRILARTRSDKLKAVREALDQFLSSLQGLTRN